MSRAVARSNLRHLLVCDTKRIAYRTRRSAEEPTIGRYFGRRVDPSRLHLLRGFLPQLYLRGVVAIGSGAKAFFSAHEESFRWQEACRSASWKDATHRSGISRQLRGSEDVFLQPPDNARALKA